MPKGKAAGALTAVFALKLVVLLQLREHPLLQPDAGLDTTAYAQLAERVVAGDLALGPGVYFVSPLYIYFLAGGLALFDSFTAVRVLQVLLGTASIALIFLTTREWFGERAAWLAAGAAALTGLFTLYEVLILQSSIDAFLTSAALFVLTRALRGRGAKWFVAAGIVFGIAALNRPNMPIGAAGVIAALLLMRRFTPAALLLAGIVAGLSPAAIRNAVVAGQWTVVSSHGGLNFYIGNGEGATGFYRQVPGISPTIGGQEKDARRVAGRALGRPVTDAEASAYFVDRAWTWIRTHPGDALALFARKLYYVFNAQHVALPHSYPFYAYDVNTLLRVLVVGPWLLIPLGLVGLLWGLSERGGAERGELLAWAGFVPGYAVAVATFFIAERYRLPLMVPLCVGAGAALDHAVGARAVVQPFRAATPRRRLPGRPEGLHYDCWKTHVATFVVLLVAANWPLRIGDGRWEEGLRTAQRLIILGKYDEADRWVEQSEPRAPRPGATHYGAGAQLLVANQFDRALGHLTKAHQLNPSDAGTEYALGQALLYTGRARDAIPHLRRGFEAGVPLPNGGYDYAAALLDTGDAQGAVNAVRRIAPPDDGEDPEPWLRLGRLAARAKAPDAAEPYFRRAVEIRPTQASARQQRGLNLLVLGRLDEAARELAEAVRLDGRDADSLAHLAYCELRLGRTPAARAHLASALAIDPNHPLARRLADAIR